MVQQHVLLADRVEHRSAGHKHLDRRRHVRRVLEGGAVDQVGDLHQPHQVDRAAYAVHVLLAQAGFEQQAARHGRGGVGRNLQAHGVAEVAGRQFALQCFAQVRDIVL